MSKLLRLALVALVIVIAFLAILLIGANLYVQSRGTQARIEQELSRRLGTPVRIRSIAVTPWGGLTLAGLTIPQTNAPPGGNFLEARAFQVRLRLSALLAKRITIKEIALVDPTIVWPQARDGKWRLPAATAAVEETARVASEEATGVSSSPNESVLSPPAPAPSPSRTVPENPRVSRPTVQHISIKNGDFTFLNSAGATFARFAGVDVRSTIDPQFVLRGDARIEQATLRDRFELTQFRTPFRYTPEKLELSKISGHAAGGDVNGNFTLAAQTPGSPYELAIKFRNLDADELVRQAGGPGGTIEGKLEGDFAGRGQAADANSFTGAGELSLRNGQMRQYNLLVTLGQIFQIEELTQLHLEEAHLKYHVDLGLITLEEMVLRSTNLRLTAHGTVDFEGRLNLDARLAINDKIREQLFKPMRANFQPTDEPGISALDFQINGTLERPKTNLVEKVVGRDIKDLGDVVRSLFGRGNKADKPKKRKLREALPPDDSDSPPPDATP